MLCCIIAYSGTSGSLSLNYKIEIVDDEQEKESIIRMRMGKKNLSLSITDCHHSASLVMPIRDPQADFFYPTLTLMIDSCNLIAKSHKTDLHILGKLRIGKSIL